MSPAKRPAEPSADPPTKRRRVKKEQPSALDMVLQQMLDLLGESDHQKLVKNIKRFGKQISIISLCSGSEIQGYP